MNKKTTNSSIVDTDILYLIVITFIFVFQNFRELFVHLTYNFELSPSSFAPILLLLIIIFGSGMLAGLVSRWLGLKFGITLLTALIGLLRFGLQIFIDPMFDLVIGVLGAICFFLWFPLLVAAIKKRQQATLLFGFLFGMIADTALHGVFVTYGLAARHTIGSISLVLILLGIQLFLLKKSQDSLLPDEFGVFRNFIPLMGWGFIVFLNFMFFQNIALVASATGFHLAIALLVLMIGNALSILVVLLSSRLERVPQSIIFVIFGVLFIVIVGLYPKGSFPIYLFWYGQIFLALAIYFIVTGQKEFSGKSINWLAFCVGIGGLSFGFLMVLYYLGYLIPLLFDNHWCLVFAATMVVVFGYLGTRKIDKSIQPLKYKEIQVFFGSIVLVTILFPLIVWFSYPRIDTLPPDGKDTVRVMTYNLHNGIDTSGKMSIDEQVEIIKASGADIINLQEVSRGWSINGQFDMLFYLQDKLKTPYVLFMPTADAQWGIAILSYFPITAYQFVELSAPPLVMGRGFIWVDIDLGSKNISLINAHLHHLTDQDATKWRIIEVNEIIEFEDKHPADLVVGDMNASPGSEEMNIFIESGLIDAQKEAGSGEGLTWIYGNYIKPTRLDYIYGNKDVIFSNLVVHESSASDHLSVTVDVQLP